MTIGEVEAARTVKTMGQGKKAASDAARQAITRETALITEAGMEAGALLLLVRDTGATSAGLGLAAAATETTEGETEDPTAETVHQTLRDEDHACSRCV